MTPDGERLEDVERGDVRPGEYLITLPVVVDDRDYVSAEGLSLCDLMGDPYRAEDFSGATWQRVVKDPPLPTTPGTDRHRQPIDPANLRNGHRIVAIPVEQPIIAGIVEGRTTSGHVKVLQEGSDPALLLDPEDYNWNLIVEGPPLPEEPGRVIRAMAAGSDRPRVYVSEIDEVNGLIWVDTNSRGTRPHEITRVLYVYPEPGEEH